MKLWCKSHEAWASRYGKLVPLGPYWIPGKTYQNCDAVYNGDCINLISCYIVDARRYWCNSHNEFDRDYNPRLPDYKQHCDVSDYKARGHILLPCRMTDLKEIGLEIIEDDEEFSTAPD